MKLQAIPSPSFIIYCHFFQWELPGKGSYKTASAKPIKSAGVVGAGTMGTGIVMAILNAGIPVTLLEVSEERLQQGVKVLKGLYAGSVQRGKMSVEKAKKLFSRLTPTVSYGDLAQCDIVSSEKGISDTLNFFKFFSCPLGYIKPMVL